MSAPFDFRKAYGKLGNWQGTIGVMPAQTIYMAASQCPPNAKFVEVGFDGGRTTIALNWAASALNAKIISIAGPAAPIWFARAVALYRMQGRAFLEREVPLDGDLYVFNRCAGAPGAGFIEAVKAGAIIIVLGQVSINDERLTVISQHPEISVWQRTAHDRMVSSIIDKVVEDMSEKVVALDTHRGPDVRGELHGGGKSGKRHRGGNSSDSKVHSILDAGKTS